MQHLLNHLIQRHVLPILLLPVVLSGFFCFAVCELPAAFRSASSDWIILLVLSLMGIFGSVATGLVLRAVRNRVPSWRVFELGRTAWTVLISAAWLAGVACGILMLYETAR